MKNILKQIQDKIAETFESTPPTIGVIGVSGVGKSSTLNAMFKTNLKTSPTIRCTTEFSDHYIGTTINSGPKKGAKSVLRVIDAPGLGEDIRQDNKYLEMYMENLPQCDVILWILSARNRAIALDQQYLLKLKDFYDRMIFGINQVDLVEPVDWNYQKNLPSETQQKHLEEITNDKRKRIEDVIGKSITITAYGAKQYYRLSQLFESMLESCPEERLWLFQMIKGFSAKDWLDRVQGLTEKEKKEILRKAK